MMRMLWADLEIVTITVVEIGADEMIPHHHPHTT